MNRIDWVLFGLVLVLAASAFAVPAGGLGFDGRHLLAAALAASIALRGTTPMKETA